MAGFSMNKVLGSIKKRPVFGGGNTPEEAAVDPTNANETPEAVATRCVKQFCNSVGSSSGDDVIFLPSIVEAAVASPPAAAECARLIRKYMSRDYWSKPSCQYNAIMLIRILADNPGPGFTRYMDKKFVDTAKDLLRTGRDGSVRQMLMETLDSFEKTKAYDEGLAPLIEMWNKEKEKAYKAYGGVPMAPVPRTLNAPGFDPQQYQRSHSSNRIPEPVELANRLEEARTSAKLLEQVVACTPPSEVLSNELIKEFADRCLSASRSIQGYMSAEDPAPDNDTMENLIDTNEQLQQALNQHHRAVLQAKKHLGLGDSRSSNNSSPAPQSQQRQRPQQQQEQSPVSASAQSSSRAISALPNRKAVAGGSNSNKFDRNGYGSGGGSGNGKGKATLDTYNYDNTSLAIAGPSRSASATPRHLNDDDEDDDGQDPFRDPAPAGKSGDSPARLSYEPFHPGFGSGGIGGGSSSAAGGGSRGGGSGVGGSGGSRALETAPSVSEYSESDAYGATPKEGGHVYRY